MSGGSGIHFTPLRSWSRTSMQQIKTLLKSMSNLLVISDDENKKTVILLDSPSAHRVESSYDAFRSVLPYVITIFWEVNEIGHRGSHYFANGSLFPSLHQISEKNPSSFAQVWCFSDFTAHGGRREILVSKNPAISNWPKNDPKKLNPSFPPQSASSCLGAIFASIKPEPTTLCAEIKNWSFLVQLPGSLQHQDRVLALVRYGGRSNVLYYRETRWSHVPVASAGQSALLNAQSGISRTNRFETTR